MEFEARDEGLREEKQESKEMKSKKQKLKERCVKLATKLKLLDSPNCLFCGKKANTCHHFIHQSRSNFLRCDFRRNLIPICTSCHYKLHNGYEAVMALELERKLGKKWAEGLIRDSRIIIKDNLAYWKAEEEDLLKRLKAKGGE